MKFLGFIILTVIFLKVAEAKKETKKIIIEVPKKVSFDPNKGKREAALHGYSYSPPRPAHVVHIQAPSNSLHLGAGYSLGGSKFLGNSISTNAHSYSPPTFPLFTPHSPSLPGPVYSSPSQYSSHGGYSNGPPRYTSISAVYKPSGKYSSSNTGPQIFGSSHLGQPQAPISQPSSIYGFSSPVPSLPHYSETKGLGSFGSLSSHAGFSAPSGSYGAPSFGGSHGSLLSSFGGFGGHSSSDSSFAGFFDTHDKPSNSYIGSSSSFKPSTFLGSSISSPSSSYGAPSFSSQSHSSPSSSHSFPSFSSHSSSPFSSHSSSPFSSHGSSLSNSYIPTLSSHSPSPSSSYAAPSLPSHSSSSSGHSSPSFGGHGSSHGSLSSGSLGSLSIPSSHGSLPFTLSDSDKAKLLSGMPIYITSNQLSGHAAGFESASLGSHGSPSLSGSHEIPSAGHAAPALSFSHLLGNPVASSSSYAAPSHGSPDFSNALGHEAPSSSYAAPSSGYATHEEPSESYEGNSDGKGFLSGFASSVSHESSASHGSPSFSSGHGYSGSSDNLFNSISSGKLELPSLKSPQLFSSSDHGAPSTSYLPGKSYSPPASSYGIPHETYGLPKSTFLINADSHDASSDTTYNTIKYSRSLPVNEKAKKATT